MITQRCRVIAHRGASHRAVENTVDAFVLARALGADMVELDVRRTREGFVVVHHDAWLADGRPIVTCAARTLPSHVPSLVEALAACAGMDVNVEIKNGVNEPDHDPSDAHLSHHVAAIDDALRDGRAPSSLLVSSFNHLTLRRVRATAPHLATAILTYAPPSDAGAGARGDAEAVDLRRLDGVLREAIDTGHRALHPHDPTITADLVARAHRAGLAVNVWTVDDPERMAALVAMGVDGIITNVPDVARAVVDATGSGDR